MPPRATLRAFALAELVRKGTATTLADTTTPVTDLTLTHHHDPNNTNNINEVDDDLDEPCDGDGEHTGCGDQCNRHHRSGPRYPLTPCNDEYITLDGTTLTADELGCRICDPVISILKFAGNNAVLNLQRTQRLANREQRRALAARDGGCIFPGCDCPVSWTDKHHVNDWNNGGLTDLRNFACLCRFHHGVTHRAGWTMVANGNGTFTWTTPAGRTLHSQSHTARNRGSPQLLLS
jgi:hypothetical protein